MGEFFKDEQGLVVNEGRHHIEGGLSGTHEWRPSKKIIEGPGIRRVDRPEGIKKVERAIADGTDSKRREKLHIRQVQSKEEFSDLPMGVKIVMGQNGLPAKDQVAQEVDLSRVLTRKRGVGTLDAQRNGIACTSLGDKHYKHPEYSDRYHQIGGTTVGSTFVQGSFAKTVPRNSTAWKAFAAENPDAVKRKTYKELQKEARERDAMYEVRSLTGTSSENKQATLDPTYVSWVKNGPPNISLTGWEGKELTEAYKLRGVEYDNPDSSDEEGDEKAGEE